MYLSRLWFLGWSLLPGRSLWGFHGIIDQGSILGPLLPTAHSWLSSSHLWQPPLFPYKSSHVTLVLLLFLVKNLFCCLWCNKKNPCSLCKNNWLRRKPTVSCVGTIHNVISRPLLQIVLVTKCVQTLLCSCGEGVGGGKVRWEDCWAFFLNLLQMWNGLANLLRMQ